VGDGGNQGRKQRPWPERQARSLNAAVRTRGLTGGPHRFDYFPDFLKQCELVNSKRTSSNAPNILKFCMVLDWSILNNFINCADF
jgi:hypothetical protein